MMLPNSKDIQKTIRYALDMVDECRPLSEEEVLRVIIPATMGLVNDAYFAGLERAIEGLD